MNRHKFNKMNIYGYGTKIRHLIKDYLSYRSQYVNIGYKNSDYLWMRHGVPQGSCVGPILYLILTNEMPSVMAQDCYHGDRIINEKLHFGKYCKKCGLSSSYADNSNFTIILPL